MNRVIRANVCVVCPIIVSGIVHKGLLYLSYGSCSVLFWSSKFTMWVGLSVMRVLVLTVMFGLLLSSLGLPVSSGMSSPSSSTMVLLASSSDSGRKATCMMLLTSSSSADFMSCSCCVDVNDVALGFILGVG